MQVIQKKESLEGAVLATLQYFHLFRHPLYIEEIQKFLGEDVTISDLYATLNTLLGAGDIFLYDNFYMMVNNPELVTRRLEGKDRADKLISKAQSAAALVAKFPFVQCVCISGSLSKGYANERSDIDFFIITAKNRLWICRSLLHMFKKITFLWGAQNAYCMNYFIDESKLCLEEQNRFTATELATLIPVYNPVVHKQIIDANKCWLVKTFPNINWNSDVHFSAAPKKGLRLVLEPLFNVALPKQLNILFMNITDKWWRFKWRRKGYPMQDYDLAMKTRWYVSKNHPGNYQKKVLKQLSDSVEMPLIPAVG